MMSRAKKPLEILDQCLDRIQSNEASIAECLDAFPEYADFLEPFLSTATRVRSGLTPEGPSQTYAQNTKIRVLNQIRSQHQKPIETKARRRLRLLWSSRPAFAIASLAMVLILMLSGIGVTTASAQSLPGDTLYGVKRGIEEIRLAFTWTVAGDIDLLAEFTQERLDELEQLSTSQRSSDFEMALEGYTDLLSRLLEIAENEDLQEDPETLEKIHGGITNHEEVLQSVLEKAPPSAQKGLENAIERSSHGKSVIETIQQGGNPSDLAPGQDKKETNEQDKGKPDKDNTNPKGKTTGPKPKDTLPDPQDPDS
jgi:hypothetical protein